jgi:hypothetical protein
MSAAAAFADAGRVMLAALAAAARDNTSLAEALAATPAGGDVDSELAQFAAALAEFRQCGPSQRAFGLKLVRDVLAFVNRPGGGRSFQSR